LNQDSDFDSAQEKEPSLSDNIILLVFGTLSAIGVLFAVICLVFAMKNAKRPEGELKMAFWSFGALAGLVFAGMSFAYFVIPILLNQWFKSPR
jgi:uncharacterized integral membrane protein